MTTTATIIEIHSPWHIIITTRTAAIVFTICVAACSLTYALFSSTASMPNVSSTDTSLRSICHAHYLSYNLHSARPPETFFSLLGLDCSIAPFTSSWTRIDDPQYGKAQDAINLAWAERKQRLYDQDAGAAENKVLDLVAYHLSKPDLADVYVEIVMPRIKNLKGARRLAELKDICKGNWGDSG